MAKTRSKSKATRKLELPIRSEDIPVTQVMLYEVRDELKADVRSVHGRFDSLEGRMDSYEGRMDSYEGRMDSYEGRMDSYEGRMDSFEGRMDSLEGRIVSIEGKIDSLRGEIRAQNGRFDALDGKFTAEFHKLALLIEEQNSRNRFVLDGLGALLDLPERVRRLETER